MTLSQSQQTLYQALSNLDARYIEEACSKPHRPAVATVQRIGAAVAIIVVILCAPILWRILVPVTDSGMKLNPVANSPFILSVQGNDDVSVLPGEDKVYLGSENLLSSELVYVPEFTEKKIWGLGIHLANKDNLSLDAFYDAYQVTVYCKEKPINGDFYGGYVLLRRQYIDTTPIGFHLVGWIADSVDLTIVLTDKSGTELQSQTVRIIYQPERLNYTIETIAFHMLGQE